VLSKRILNIGSFYNFFLFNDQETHEEALEKLILTQKIRKKI